MMVDTSGSQRNVLDSERTASMQFLRQVMRPDRDLAFVIHFDSEIELLQDLTADKIKLTKAIDLCEPSDRPQFQQQGGQGGQYPNGGGYPGGGYPGGGRRNGGGARGGTSLYDSIYLACDEVIKKQTGRKALVLLTDGVDHGSKYTLDMAIESAQRADTMLYSVLFSDPHGYGNGPMMSGPGMGRRRAWAIPAAGTRAVAIPAVVIPAVAIRAAARRSQWQKGSATARRRNRRTLFRGFEEVASRQGLRRD